MKFGMYCSLPVAASVIYGRPETMNEIVKAYNFIVYPASDKTIQTMSRKEFQEAVLEESRRIREGQVVDQKDKNSSAKGKDSVKEASGKGASRPWYKLW